MGCYLSKVDDKVFLTQGEGKGFKYATASCRGWRREQEDAEACITDFDENASLFVLCDGHGGAEVAKYTVAHLPEFIKNHRLYEKGNFKEALEQAFIDFDAHLRTDAVMKELARIALDDEVKGDNNTEEECKEEAQFNTSAGPSSSSNNGASGSSASEPPGGSHAASSSSAGPSTSNGSSSVADDVDTETLRREAQVPIAELINKYADSTSRTRIQSLRRTAYGQSPVIRSKEAGDNRNKSAPEPSGSSSKDEPEPSSSKSNSDDGPSSTSDEQPNLDVLKSAVERYFKAGDDSEDDSEFEASDDSSEDDEDDDDDDDEDQDDDDDDDDDGDDEGDEETEGKRSKILSKRHKRSAAEQGETSSEEEDDDSEQEDEDSEDESEGGDEDDDDDDAETSEEADEDDTSALGNDVEKVVLKKFRSLGGAKMSAAVRDHTPGMDSGCTVVVALVKDGKLYVANAGDSRCIVILRNGKCVPMSFDHKPEDPLEYRRIFLAGGHVTDGRVNGGLNLSRAFGDFTYKNASLQAKDQMITPCPDVKTFLISPEEVEYIFLACDGIWNSMKNTRVAGFIRTMASEVPDLSDICAGLFKNCLSPNTDCDGTGCDNMTCILVRYNRPKEGDPSTNNQIDLKSTETTTTTNDENKVGNKGKDENEKEEIKNLPVKRPAEEDELDEGGHDHKRRCLRLLEPDLVKLPGKFDEAPILTSEESSDHFTPTVLPLCTPHWANDDWDDETDKAKVSPREDSSPGDGIPDRAKEEKDD